MTITCECHNHRLADAHVLASFTQPFFIPSRVGRSTLGIAGEGGTGASGCAGCAGMCSEHAFW